METANSSAATSPLVVRRRGAKVNRKQKQILLLSMVDNPLVYSRKTTAEFTINHHKAFWRYVSVVLNIYGPPKKTVESWKKAWKDIRARYLKVGIGLKEFSSITKCGNAVNVKLLLEKANQIDTLMKGKGDLEQALRDSIIAEADNSELMLTNMEESHTTEQTSTSNLSEINLDENETVLNIIGNTEENLDDSCSVTVRTEKPEDDDLCEIAYEEILESDFEYSNDSDTVDSPNLYKRKLTQMKNGFSTDDYETEPEVEVLNRGESVKKPKLSPETSSSPSTDHSHGTESRNVQDSSVLNSLLAELRQHNKIQSEKLALNKKRFETKKKFLEQSLSVKKDIAKAHNLLAKSVKTFIDNISFNS